jgi:CDP-paratose synthetase
MEKKTILITGINGFLGSHLAKTLVLDYNIIGLENSIENLNRIKEFSFKVYSSKDNLENIFTENKINAIIHAATVYSKINEPLEWLMNTNIILPVKLYELANKYNVSKFLNSDSFFNNPDYNYDYLSDYTLSKRQVIEWLKLIKGECELINMKIFHMFGNDDAPNKFVSQIISALQNNQPFVNLSLGEQKRDFIFIDDVVSAYRFILGNNQKSDNKMDEFEIGTGVTVSIRKFVELIKKITQSNTQLRFGALPYRGNEIMNSLADNSKLISLGWTQQFSLIEGLNKTIKPI